MQWQNQLYFCYILLSSRYQIPHLTIECKLAAFESEFICPSLISDGREEINDILRLSYSCWFIIFLLNAMLVRLRKINNKELLKEQPQVLVSKLLCKLLFVHDHETKKPSKVCKKDFILISTNKNERGIICILKSFCTFYTYI